jgi:hypothetical protein
MSYDLVDLLKNQTPGVGSGGGIVTTIYAFLKRDVKTWPARGADLVTIATAFVLNTGKYVHQIYATHQTIEPKETKLPGENKDCGGVEISLPFFHPGISEAIQSFKAKYMNEDFILAFVDANLTKTLIIGEQGNPAWIEGWDTGFGKTVADGKGTTFTFKCQQSLPMAIYTSDITALLDQSSGSTSPSPSPSGI